MNLPVDRLADNQCHPTDRLEGCVVNKTNNNLPLSPINRSADCLAGQSMSDPADNWRDNQRIIQPIIWYDNQ